MKDKYDNERYIATIVPVPQAPVDNNNNIVVVYDRDKKLCACSNKHKSSFKNKKDAIEKLIIMEYSE